MDIIYSKNPDIIFRNIAGEFILVPVRNKAVDLKSVYTLNETAAFIWGIIDGATGLSKIQDKVSEEFEVEISQARADVSEIVSQLEAMSLIQKS